MQAIRLILAVIIPIWAEMAFAADPLPRVLILGDRVYDEPARKVAKELKGHVEVVYRPLQPGEVRETAWALANLDELLGEGQWDLIHFNFGLGDLVHRAPRMKAFRVMTKKVGGVRATTPKQYEQNLEELTRRLKATGAILVWANTTPIRSTPNGIFDLGSEVKYNAIANKVMADNKVLINNMHDYVSKLINMKRPAPHGWDPFHFDRKPLHPPIVRVIVRELQLRIIEK
ncbi:MAG: SGNH/GDSL hydrolase family protein [Gemmataceae bacterium]